jgi:trehalose-6-phosphatase
MIMEKKIFFAVHFRNVTKENGKNIAFYVNIIEKSKQEILFYHFPAHPPFRKYLFGKNDVI